jgi:fructuronate reductase
VRLSAGPLGALAPDVARFGYDRAAQAAGIVHLGIGAFHRAHQAWYTDAAMTAGDRDWAITGVSLRSAEVARQLNPQDGLYTVTERSADGWRTRLIGAVRQVHVAGQEPLSVITALAAPATRIVSLTVTEKGYARAADGGLDPALAGPGTIYPLLATALRLRHDGGLPGLTLLSCDNLADNGRQLARLMGEYLDRHDPALLGWFGANCACPSTMVDRIVPTTTDADRSELAARIGLEDRGAVMTEPFSQWVIEDRFAGQRPRWEMVGAELVADVRAYETAKLRMLNGAHSLLAYGGLARGHAFVHQAIADPALRALVERLLREEAAPSIAAAPGQDLNRYADALIARFANPALEHRLAQIAMDGSQKIPQRWLETLAFHQAQGRQCPAIMAGIAAWIAHLRGANGPVDDPRAADLAAAAAEPDPVRTLFGQGGLIPSGWMPEAFPMPG